MLKKKFIWLAFMVIILSLLAYYFYPYSKIPAGVTIDKIMIIKSRRQLFACANGKIICIYDVAIGKQPVGQKLFEGDQRTPEGNYFIRGKNPGSSFHKSLGISYPNAADIAEAKKNGKPPGGDIKIHGLRNDQWYLGRFHRWKDWTDGCIAITDEEMDDLYSHTLVGAKILILP